MTSETKKMLTPVEAAEYLGLAEKTLRNLRALDIPGTRPRHYKVGRKVRYRISDLDDFLKNRHK